MTQQKTPNVQRRTDDMKLNIRNILIAYIPALLLVVAEKTLIFQIIKLPEMRFCYPILFSSLLLVCLLIFSLLKHISIVKSCVIGAVLGQLVGFISLLISNLFIPNGVVRTFATIKQDGFLSVLSTDLFVAFILGGWLIGMSVFTLYSLVSRNTQTKSHSINRVSRN